MRALLLMLLSCMAAAEQPGIQFSPLRIESAQVGDALGWRVSALVLTDGLVGRMCLVRFRLAQGDKHWEETRKRAIQLPQWAETSFYKRSFLDERFDTHLPIEVSFSIVDVVNQRDLGSTSATLTAEAPLVVEARVVHYGKVVYRGRVDLTATFTRAQHEPGKPYQSGKLPKHPKGYWREYVHPTDGVRGDGPQRLIVGQAGELFYTPDLHRSFVDLGTRTTSKTP